MPSSFIATLGLLVAATVAGAQTTAPASATAAPRQVPVEVVSTNPFGQTITVRQPARLNVATTDNPEDTSIVTLLVQSGAVSGLRSVRSGQEVLITCAAPAGVDTGTTIAGSTGGSPAAVGTAVPWPGAATASTPRPQAGTMGSAAGEDARMGGMAAGDTSGTLGGTAAGSAPGTTGTGTTGGTDTTIAGRIPAGSAASATAATSAGATPTFPAPGSGPGIGTGSASATSVRPLSSLQGHCDVAAVRPAP